MGTIRERGMKDVSATKFDKYAAANDRDWET